ncbi:MAG: hypothetical protein WDN45_03190 [Caulobacteraceae bacterium]
MIPYRLSLLGLAAAAALTASAAQAASKTLSGVWLYDRDKAAQGPFGPRP